MFEKDKLLLSFLLAYKELECEVTIDMRQVEFFIKGPLAQESEIFNPINLSDYTPDNEELNRQRTQANYRQRRRQQIAPWITPTQWKALEKLSLIPPFN